MLDRLKSFSSGKKINLSVEVPESSENSYGSFIGGLLKDIREQQGKTLKEIAEILTIKIGRPVSLSSLYNWGVGTVPRGEGVAEIVENTLRKILQDDPSIVGGAWCSPGEVQRRMKAFEKQFGPSELSQIGDIPLQTIFNWIRGSVRVKRERFEHFESAINEFIKSSQGG